MKKLIQLKNELPHGVLTWNGLRKMFESDDRYKSYGGYYIFQNFEANTENIINEDFLRARCFEEIMKTKVVGKDFLDIKAMLNPYVGTPEKHEDLKEKLMRLSRLI